MGDQEHSTNWLYAFNRRLASIRPVAWLFSHTFHHLDRLVIRLSDGRHTTATNLLTGLPIITLTATGAKSGQSRSVPLIGIPDGENILLIASNFGRSFLPAWYHNLKAHPEATVTLGQESKPYLAHEAVGAEWEAGWQTAVSRYAGYAAYQKRAGRHIPVMVLTPKNNNS